MLRCAPRPQGPAGCPPPCLSRLPDADRRQARCGLRSVFIYGNNRYILFIICRAGGGRAGAELGGRGSARTPRAVGRARRRRREQAGSCSSFSSVWARPLPSAASGRAEPSASGKGELAAVGTPPVGNGPARVPVVSWREGAVPSPRDGGFGCSSSQRPGLGCPFVLTRWVFLGMWLGKVRFWGPCRTSLAVHGFP